MDVMSTESDSKRSLPRPSRAVRAVAACALALLAAVAACSRPPAVVAPLGGPAADAGMPPEASAPPPRADAGTPETAEADAPPADAADAGTPEPEAQVPEEVRGDEEHPVRIFFEPNKTEIPDIARGLLDAVAERLRLRPTEVVRLVAHSDAHERPGHEMELSQQRAEAVVEYFAQHGVPRERFIINARSDFEPAGDADTADGQRNNQRVDFVFERGVGP